ncbi:hypothetical protein GGX14DRAFT_398531 [Mycena pura]|uniref:Uncharacterized protein n=1 Tax=Mycena pura TaxID=153505 RepID=A0AAD6V6S1_9AGAR|nr:hypothetical protein GGX14DRAFT_398531 [Mycena pura]
MSPQKKPSSPQKLPRKIKSSSPAKVKTSSPGIQNLKLRKEWKDALKPWEGQGGFMHPEGVKTVTKSAAKAGYKLDDDDLAALPVEIERRPPLKAISKYSADQVMELAKRKCEKLGRPLEVNGLVYHSHSGSGSSQTGGVSIVSVKNPLPLPAWDNHILNAQPPPLKISDYTCPPSAVIPDPEKIHWVPSRISGPVTVKDACRLYCSDDAGLTQLSPNDIRDLSDRSPWIDLATVAKRALTLHGGFYAHKEFLHQRRQDEEDTLTREISQADKRKSRFRFSQMILKQWMHTDDDGMYDGRSTPEHSVAVLYPIKFYSDDDYGCDWNWMPRFLGEALLYIPSQSSRKADISAFPCSV